MNTSAAIVDPLLHSSSLVIREARDGMSESVLTHARYEIRFTRNAFSAISGCLRLKRRLRCGLSGRLLEWHSWISLRKEREKRHVPERRDPKFGVRRSEDLEPSLAPPALARRASRLTKDQ
jgi:hypothetical protein